jgi:peptidoglycan/LPS O-acetylase OafA/YrhL
MLFRNYAIDKLRMISAFIVVTGHISKYTVKDDPRSNLIYGSFFQLGFFAVLLFFALSGTALRYQTDKFGLTRNWIVARQIRLLPMYWLAFVIPIFLFTYVYNKELNYPWYGYLLTLFGMNSYFSEIRIPPVNNPLWSLSVEIQLSLFLIIIGKFKKTFYLLICLLMLIIASFAFGEKQPIAIAVPIFYLGYILPSFNIKPIKSASTNKILTIIFTILFISISNIILISDINTNRGKLLQYILIFLLLLFCLVNPGTKKTVFAKYSQRSYALYACHFPIILIYKKLFFDNSLLNGTKIFVLLVIIAVSTEIIYKLIDLPSIKVSRAYLNRL